MARDSIEELSRVIPCVIIAWMPFTGFEDDG